MPVEQLIVGWNRGGLGYVHQLLEKADFDVGLTFGPDTTAKDVEEKYATSSRYEVSPYIVPFLDHPLLKNVKVTFILRDPMRVLNSLYFHGLFHGERDSAVQRAAFAHLPGLYASLRGMPAQAGCEYLLRWLEMSKKKSRYRNAIRIEEGPQSLLRHITGTSVKAPFILPTVNGSNCKQTIVPSVLPSRSRENITKLLVKLGYREWAWFPRGGHAHYVNADWHC